MSSRSTCGCVRGAIRISSDFFFSKSYCFTFIAASASKYRDRLQISFATVH